MDLFCERGFGICTRSMVNFVQTLQTDANRKMIITQRFADYIAGLYKFFVCIYILAS